MCCVKSAGSPISPSTSWTSAGFAVTSALSGKRRAATERDAHAQGVVALGRRQPGRLDPQVVDLAAARGPTVAGRRQDRFEEEALEVALLVEEARARAAREEIRREDRSELGEPRAQAAPLLQRGVELRGAGDRVVELEELLGGDGAREHDRPGGVPARGELSQAVVALRRPELGPFAVPRAAPRQLRGRDAPLLDRGEEARVLLLVHGHDRSRARDAIAVRRVEDLRQESLAVGHRSRTAERGGIARPSLHGLTARRTWRLLALELAVGEPEEALRDRACRALGIDPARLRAFRIAKKALDARRRGGVRRLAFVVHVDLSVDAGFRSGALAKAARAGRVVEAPRRVDPTVDVVHASLRGSPAPRIAVVGAGPAGLFAALVLARHGVAVTLLDRGSRVDRRSRELVRFHRTRTPDPESNLLFGEGGAGTYSDGKLYTRVDDPLEPAVLEELVAAGAASEILYDGRAHIGTDRLHRILPALRATLESAGVSFAWNTRLEGIVLAPGPERAVRALATSAGEIACDAAILALGHSARDTFAGLEQQGVPFEGKPFQIGVRIEHPQELVDRSQHGVGPEASLLGPAYYQLVCRAEAGALAAHSFCMCPGGRIVASVNEPGFLCTNGMSNAGHSSRFANAAVVVTLDPADLGSGAFAGIAYQRDLERRFFEAGGGDYTAPAQRADDFLAGRATAHVPRASYTFGTRPARIDELLPAPLRDGLRHALARFDRAIPGFAGGEGVLVGIESRSACPVRIPRDRITRRAAGFANLLPAGEGAGYAGGIMSAALDGVHCALALLEHGVARTGSAR